MQIKKAIPHLFTLGNLACGCISIYCSLNMGNLIFAAFFVFAGMFLDFFDGLAARLLKVPGEFGKQLDSLADMVSFGVAPAASIYTLISSGILGGGLLQTLAPLSLLLALFSAVRLAKFNIDTRQTTSFMGLPTPANAIFWVMLPLAFLWGSRWLANMHSVSDSIGGASATWKGWLILALIPIFSLLMIVDLPLFALKIKNLKWQDNQIRFLFLGLAAATLIMCYSVLHNVAAAFPIIVVLYLILSVINNAISKTDEV